MSNDDVTAELVALFNTSNLGLDKDERAALADKVVARVRRLAAERDGWKAIATELLEVAFGKGNAPGDGALPPLEIIELREVCRLDTACRPLLEQFWRDLTAKHERLREAKPSSYGLASGAAMESHLSTCEASTTGQCTCSEEW